MYFMAVWKQEIQTLEAIVVMSQFSVLKIKRKREGFVMNTVQVNLKKKPILKAYSCWYHLRTCMNDFELGVQNRIELFSFSSENTHFYFSGTDIYRKNVSHI